MNDNDVIKALECLHKRILQSKFAEEVTETEIMGLVNALDLIKRREEEINRLQKESDDKERAYTEEYILRKEMKDDINRLTIELQAMRGSTNSYKMHYEKEKAERNLLNLKIRDLNKECAELSKEHWNDWEIHCNAIAEFAERLKVKLPYITSHLGNVSVMTLHRQIDTLVKEMIQEGGGADA